MKRIHTLLAIGILLTSGPVVLSAAAQDQTSTSSTFQMRTPDEVVNTLATKLNLTDDQKSQIKPIIADRQQQLAALKADTSMRPRKKLRKLKGIFNDSSKKIEAVLNDQQKQQYAQLEQQMREQVRERIQNRAAMNGDSQ